MVEGVEGAEGVELMVDPIIPLPPPPSLPLRLPLPPLPPHLQPLPSKPPQPPQAPLCLPPPLTLPSVRHQSGLPMSSLPHHGLTLSRPLSRPHPHPHPHPHPYPYPHPHPHPPQSQPPCRSKPYPLIQVSVPLPCPCQCPRLSRKFLCSQPQHLSRKCPSLHPLHQLLRQLLPHLPPLCRSLRPSHCHPRHRLHLPMPWPRYWPRRLLQPPAPLLVYRRPPLPCILLSLPCRGLSPHRSLFPHQPPHRPSEPLAPFLTRPSSCPSM